MIRLDRARRDQHRCALLLRLRNQEFQLAGLVPAKSQPRLVIALDEDARTTERLRQTRKVFDRCGEMGKIQSGK